MGSVLGQGEDGGLPVLTMGQGDPGRPRLEPHDAMKGLLPDFLKYGCFPEREKRRFQENQFHFVFI